MKPDKILKELKKWLKEEYISYKRSAETHCKEGHLKLEERCCGSVLMAFNTLKKIKELEKKK